MILKYIIVKHKQTPILFPTNSVSHKTIATNLGALISAGFCFLSIKNGKIEVNCYGNSSSLNIESNPQQDKIIIENFMNNCTKNNTIKGDKMAIKE